MPVQESPYYPNFDARSSDEISRNAFPLHLESTKGTNAAARLNEPVNYGLHEPHVQTKPQRTEPQRKERPQYSRPQDNTPSGQSSLLQDPRSTRGDQKSTTNMQSQESQGNGLARKSVSQGAPIQPTYKPYRPVNFIPINSTAQVAYQPYRNSASMPHNYPRQEPARPIPAQNLPPNLVPRAPLQHNTSGPPTLRPAPVFRPQANLTRPSTSAALRTGQMGPPPRQSLTSLKPSTGPRQSMSTALNTNTAPKTKAQRQAADKRTLNGRRQQR